MGDARYLYRDRPLFSYLYFTAPIPGGGTAMAAALIKANLPRNLEEDPGDLVTKCIPYCLTTSHGVSFSSINPCNT